MQETVNDDVYDLQRFVTAQESDYSTALSEAKKGKKQTHWMWYIFPQISGLGSSSTSIKYSIKSLCEAKAYLRHPILGKRLHECAEVLLNHDGLSALEIFGPTDTLKLKSSMTLFESVSEGESHFSRVLDEYFNGERDRRTIDLLEQMDRA